MAGKTWRTGLGWGLGLLILSIAWGAEPDKPAGATYTDYDYGFSLALPKFEGRGQQTELLMSYHAAAVDGFSSNLNVQAQKGKFTRDQYRALSEGQMKQVGFTIHSTEELQVSSADALLLDYEGKLQETPLHWLALAVIRDDHVLLVSCTAMESQFPMVKEQFLNSLKTFKLTPAR